MGNIRVVEGQKNKPYNVMANFPNLLKIQRLKKLDEPQAE